MSPLHRGRTSPRTARWRARNDRGQARHFDALNHLPYLTTGIFRRTRLFDSERFKRPLIAILSDLLAEDTAWRSPADVPRDLRAALHKPLHRQVEFPPRRKLSQKIQAECRSIARSTCSRLCVARNSQASAALAGKGRDGQIFHTCDSAQPAAFTVPRARETY